MGMVRIGALACALATLAGCPDPDARQVRGMQAQNAQSEGVVADASRLQPRNDDVTLVPDTGAVSASLTQGDAFAVALSGAWRKATAGTVYLQATDVGGRLLPQAPSLAPKYGRYLLSLPLPTSTAAGTHAGTITLRACADRLCEQPYPGSVRSIAYSLQVNAYGEWEMLQRNARHDGYVPIDVDPARIRQAWTWVRPTDGELSAVVTSGDRVFFSAPDSSAPSVYGLRASDGVAEWRRVLAGTSFGPALSPPSVSGGNVYVSTTGHQDTWLYSLRATDGMQNFQSSFSTQWGRILSPTVSGGKVYVNAGYYDGEVFAFNLPGGARAWSALGGSYGMNTPAAADGLVYAHNGNTLRVFDASSGGAVATIGQGSGSGINDYNGTAMLGSEDHVMAYSGSGYSTSRRQLVDYSVADGAPRWMSIALYSNFPAVARGTVYATSNETTSLDALDEATGRKLWSWKPPAVNAWQQPVFIGNVAVTGTLAFVSTDVRLYAIDLQRRRVVWSADTPGMVSISGGRMLYVSTPANSSTFPSTRARIVAYRLN